MKNYIVICSSPAGGSDKPRKEFEEKLEKNFPNAKAFKGEDGVWGIDKTDALPGELWLALKVEGLCVNVLEVGDAAFVKAF